jgi:Dynein heavy chain C-terminal domain
MGRALQVMNAELDEVCKAMARGAVPALWKVQSYPTLKPLASYVADLLERLIMFSDWCAHALEAVVAELCIDLCCRAVCLDPWHCSYLI